MQTVMKYWNGANMDEEFVRRIIEKGEYDENCSHLHVESCNIKALVMFARGVKSLYRIYLLAHLIPLFLFRFKRLKKNPREQLKKALFGFIRSMLFAGGNIMIARRVVCFMTALTGFDYRYNVFSVGLGGIALLFQSPTRQVEISLYCVAKGWETAYYMLKRRNYPIKMACGNLFLNAVSLAIITFVFFNQPEVFREGYRKFLSLLLKDI